MADADDDGSPQRGISSTAEELPTPIRRSPRLLALSRGGIRHDAPPTTSTRNPPQPAAPAAAPAAGVVVNDCARPDTTRRTTSRAAGQQQVGQRGSRAAAAVGGRGGRGTNKTGSGPRFSIPEMESMLRSIETILPIGPEEWELVADTHSLDFPAHNREASSLRRKFQSLYNQQVPTGDPTCPPHVRQAKRLKFQIEARVDSSNTVGGDGDRDLGFMDEEEGDDEEMGRDIEEDDNNAADGAEEARNEESGAPTEDNNNTTPANIIRQLNFDPEDSGRSRGGPSEARHRIASATARPLVRTTTPATMNRRNRGVPLEDLTTVLLTSMMTRMEREDTDREERRRRENLQDSERVEEQRRRELREDADREERRRREIREDAERQQQHQLNMAMVSSLVSALGGINPAAAAAAAAAQGTNNTTTSRNSAICNEEENDKQD